MIASMTGYGKSVIAGESAKITVDIKSINSKQLDLSFRMPVLFKEQETELRNYVGPILERGKVEISVTYENLKGVSPVKFNVAVMKRYKDDIDSILNELGLEEPRDYVSMLLRLPESVTTSLPESDDSENEMLRKAVVEAAEELKKSRLKEGRGLYEFFFEKIERIRGYLEKTGEYEHGRVDKIREKLEQQLGRLQGVEIDRGRLEQELIFYIEKLDVSEEKQRLASHLNYFEETLGEPDEVNVSGKGKKLGFISQEMGREINTLGSKSNDAEMAKLVVMMKDELEQIKEQVLNVM
ncbi:MAG: YicC family protein [Muribaculaceae bacterium]|nr:YicC family protein [Muribaculaceae bacterium]